MEFFVCKHWSANKHKLWKVNFLSFLNQCNCSHCNRRTFIFFDIEFFVYFVEVIFLIVDLDHAGRLCLHHIAFAWWSLIYFYAEQVILVKFFLNTAESSKRINVFGCTEHVMTCMLITHLSVSESAHKSRNKVLNEKYPSCVPRRSNSSDFNHASLSTAKKALRFLSPKRQVQNTWQSKIWMLFIFVHILYKSVGLFSNTEFWLCMLYVKTCYPIAVLM